MRELMVSEIGAVDGGNPAVVLVVATGILGAAAIGVAAYAAYKGCNAEASVGKDGVTLKVECKKN